MCDASSGGFPDPWQAQLSALGSFIRTQRRLADLSLREMASLTRVSNAYLSQVERGLHQPSLKVLRAIATGLGLSAEQLLTQAGWAGDGEPDSGREPDPSGRDGHGLDGRGPGRPAADESGVGDGVDNSTERAIRSDPRLTEEQREALLGVYRSFVGEPEHRRSEALSSGSGVTRPGY